MSTIPFTCPSCGNRTFRVEREPQSYEDLIGASCDTCERVLTKEDIEGKIRSIAEEKLQDMLKGFRR